MMSGIVEVELPRCTITPLDRHEDADYWKLNPNRSLLKGGSWTFMHWNRLVTGKKLYRIQYKDELRVPQAEIEFDDLIAFLLDRGAVPDENGWGLLRTSGLWTPTGTVLLRSPATAFGAALMVGVPSDSDGVLSLKMNWQSDWDQRGPDSLPPFWMRLRQPKVKAPLEEPKPAVIDSTEENAESPAGDDPKQEGSEATDETAAAEDDQPSESSEPKAIIDIIEAKRKALHGADHESDSIRFLLERDTVDRVYYELDGCLTGMTQELNRSGESAQQWFACVASSLNQDRKAGSWSFTFPPHIMQSVRRDAVPCGLMVLLDFLSDADVPPWSSARPQLSDPSRLTRRFMEAQRQRQIEATMPPAQAEATRRAREQAALWEQHEEHMRSVKLMREYEEGRVNEALISPRLSNQIVADACLAWLVKQEQVPEYYSILDLAQAALYLMALDPVQAKVISEICEQWMVWSQIAGMSRVDLELAQRNKVSFCYASAVVYAVQTVAKSEVRLSSDMQECLNVWKKVRLG
jgi:hypothetical protein